MRRPHARHTDRPRPYPIGGAEGPFRLSRPARAVLTGHDGMVRSVAFSGNGSRLASGTYRTVRLWDVALPHDLLRAVCGIARRGFTLPEWQRYFPSEPYRQSCPAAR
ncbi:hypothetical protein [Streptosporangium sp. LJ11]|uniref:hypothetical protein n=1 Tax=Streptosporangium sp. LJ11 TaxID=3436927 RepID=UPI003F7AB3D8